MARGAVFFLNRNCKSLKESDCDKNEYNQLYPIFSNISDNIGSRLIGR